MFGSHGPPMKTAMASPVPGTHPPLLRRDTSYTGILQAASNGLFFWHKKWLLDGVRCFFQGYKKGFRGKFHEQSRVIVNQCTDHILDQSWHGSLMQFVDKIWQNGVSKYWIWGSKKLDSPLLKTIPPNFMDASTVIHCTGWLYKWNSQNGLCYLHILDSIIPYRNEAKWILNSAQLIVENLKLDLF